MGAVAWSAYGEYIVDSILEAIPVGSLVIDRNGLIAFVNSPMERILGVNRKSVLGRKLRDLPVRITAIDSADSHEEGSLLSWVVTGRPVRDIRCVVRRLDGHETIVSASINPLTGHSGELIGVIATFVDPSRWRAPEEPQAELRTAEIAKCKEAEQELAAAKEFSDALNRINITINSTLEFEEVMERVIVDATKATGAESSAILLHSDDGWVARYIYGLPPELKDMRFSMESAPYIAVATKIKKIVAISDAYRDERVNPEVARTYHIRSMLVVPLVVRGESIGILIFNYHSAQFAFSEHQLDFANKLSASISLALENSRRYAAERDIADTLQEALLTIPDQLAEVEFGHLYHSATEAARVGGDFYDLFELEHGRIGVVIGDVSGKGLEAAAFTALIKNTVQAYAYENGSPASILSRTNDVILKSTPDSMFVTVFFGMLDTATGTLSYCSAGHPPVILKRRGGAMQLLEANSAAIGVMEDLTFVDGEVVLEKGDILIGYTDGVIEARYDGRFFGEEELLRFVETTGRATVAELPQAIFGEVMNRTGGELSDDMAILCLSLRTLEEGE